MYSTDAAFVPGPVDESSRIGSIDVLRGFALLGILVINIDFFALPSVIFFNPSAVGGFKGLNGLTWQFGSVFFLQKMMSIFSMLFGAGIVLMAGRFESAGRSFKGIWYRRIAWLLILGLIHAYLIWYGDILVVYAVCGLFLYPLRKLSARKLNILAGVLLIIGVFVMAGAGSMFEYIKSTALEAQSALEEGKELEPLQQEMLKAWSELEPEFTGDPKSLQEEVEAYRGGYFDALSVRVPETLAMHTQGLPFYLFWRVISMMMIGMALMKMRVLTTERSVKFYVLMSVLGLVIGLPLAIYGTRDLMMHDFDFIHYFRSGGIFGYVGSVFMALGYVGIVMLLVKHGVMRRFTDRLGAVGRMAFSNYLFQSVLCTTLFYGHGFGLFNRVERFWLFVIVVGIWTVQLVFSPLWLRYFRFGPVEWLWRSLTYWKRQPMRVTG
jgi:uncharacterized protein